MNVLTVNNLTKVYPSFTLDNVSFSIKQGEITGFIGKNGAGKSTTLNSLLNFVHPDGGSVEIFGMNFEGHEKEIKQRIGFVSSGVNYYHKKSLKKISKITKTFYENWDDFAYQKYMKMFGLDENKTPSKLSAGMKVKYALALALSHNADLLILDEPTSGLDPVSRDDLLDIFMELCEKGKTILFSTHITSDLDKCAENIIYIKNGKILTETSVKEFESTYKIVVLNTQEDIDRYNNIILGKRKTKDGYTALVYSKDLDKIKGTYLDATLESIMIHIEKEDK